MKNRIGIIALVVGILGLGWASISYLSYLRNIDSTIVENEVRLKVMKIHDWAESEIVALKNDEMVDASDLDLPLISIGLYCSGLRVLVMSTDFDDSGNQASGAVIELVSDLEQLEVNWINAAKMTDADLKARGVLERGYLSIIDQAGRVLELME